MEYVAYKSIHVNLSDESDNDNGDSSDQSTIIDSQLSDCGASIQNNRINQTDVIYRRTSNTRIPEENGKIQHFSNHKSSRKNKWLSWFLFLFGFASTLIILSQLYLLVYFDGSASVPGWDRNQSRSISHYILPGVNTTILAPSTLCRDNSPILLLIVICSSANNFEIRQTLRKTWANTTEFNYSKFATIHSQFKGKYLPINYADWRSFSVKHQQNSSQNVHNNTGDNKTDEASHADFQIRIVFLIGQTENNETQNRIMEESHIHNDVIQERFLDTYNNLTLKSVMMLKWVNMNCGADKVKFVMKSDDDTLVNVPNLIHFLLGGTVPIYSATLDRYNEQTMNTLSSKNRLSQYADLLIGARFCEAKPILDIRSKWFMPRYMYDEDVYPNFLSGTGYVFTMDTAEKLYNTSLTTPLLYLEDVYLTGVCAEKAGIKPQNYHLFKQKFYYDLCEVRGLITLHEIKLKDMEKAYDFIVKSNVTCTA